MDLTIDVNSNLCDLEISAINKDIRYLLPTVTSFRNDAKGPLIPVQASSHLVKEGFAIYGKLRYKKVNGEAEIIAHPDPSTLIKLPWKPHMGWLACNLYQNGKPFPQCPRQRLAVLAQQAKDLGFIMKCGIEPEFTLLKRCSHEGLHTDELESFVHHSIRSSLREDSFLTRVMDVMKTVGWGPYLAEHEAMCNQYEINFQYADVQCTADRHSFLKFLIKDIAREEGFRATFMPLPFPGQDTGNSLHVNISLWNDSENLFPDASNSISGLSEIGEQFTAGLLLHAPALTAIGCPTVNSYKRLFATNRSYLICWSVNCKTAIIRIATNERIEFRISDGTANPYLLQAALLAAGIDGIQKKLPLKQELQHHSDNDKSKFELLPKTLMDAVTCLEQDTDLLDILGRDIVESFVLKVKEQWDEFMKTMTKWEIAQADEY